LSAFLGGGVQWGGKRDKMECEESRLGAKDSADFDSASPPLVVFFGRVANRQCGEPNSSAINSALARQERHAAPIIRVVEIDNPRKERPTMPDEKLRRESQHEINVHQSDRLSLWDSSFDDDKQNLTITSSSHDVLRIYGITGDQLGDLYLQIATVLGKPPEPTLLHLREIYETVGKLIQASEPEASQPGKFSGANNDFSEFDGGF
jgi:hypothetical protein